MKIDKDAICSGPPVRSTAVPIIFLFVLCFISLQASLQAFAAQRVYQIAVIPSVPPEITYANWTPFIERLSRETGLRFSLKVYDTMTDFESDVASGRPDLIFASPTQMVMARRTRGYVPLVRSSKPVAGLIFVLNNSPIRSVKDLEGKEIAFVGSKNL